MISRDEYGNNLAASVAEGLITEEDLQSLSPRAALLARYAKAKAQRPNDARSEIIRQLRFAWYKGAITVEQYRDCTRIILGARCLCGKEAHLFDVTNGGAWCAVCWPKMIEELKRQ